MGLSHQVQCRHAVEQDANILLYQIKIRYRRDHRDNRTAYLAKLAVKHSITLPWQKKKEENNLL
jgi:hypothetical protein